MRTVSILLGVGLLSFLTVYGAHAYDPTTHQQLVEEAFAYMERYPEEYQDVLVQWPKRVHPDVAPRRILPDAAYKADERTDLRFKITSEGVRQFALLVGIPDCFTKLSAPYWGWQHFTAMQHFIRVEDTGHVWRPYDGYSYATSEYAFTDWVAIASQAILFSSVKVATTNAQCPGAHVPKWFTMKSDREALKSNLQRDLSGFIFPPANAVAAVDYATFLASRGRNFKGPDRGGLTALGRILHLAQDMTVPHHVRGVLGDGHVEYERNIQTLFKDYHKDVIDHETIAQHLKERQCLAKHCFTDQFLRELAHYTRDYERQERQRFSHLYTSRIPTSHQMVSFEPTTMGPSFRVAGHLVNLAIAANVALIKASWKNWSSQHFGSSQQTSILPVTSKGKLLGELSEEGVSELNHLGKSGKGRTPKDAPREPPPKQRRPDQEDLPTSFAEHYVPEVQHFMEMAGTIPRRSSTVNENMIAWFQRIEPEAVFAVQSASARNDLGRARDVLAQFASRPDMPAACLLSPLSELVGRLRPAMETELKYGLMEEGRHGDFSPDSVFAPLLLAWHAVLLAAVTDQAFKFEELMLGFGEYLGHPQVEEWRDSRGRRVSCKL
jgi:hypothetical protein